MQMTLCLNDRFSVGSVQFEVLHVWPDRIKLSIEDPTAMPVYREVILRVASDDDDGDDSEDTFQTYDPTYEFEYDPLAIQIS